MILSRERNSLQIQTKDSSCITRDIAIDVDIVMGNASYRVSKCPLNIISVKKKATVYYRLFPLLLPLNFTSLSPVRHEW